MTENKCGSYRTRPDGSPVIGTTSHMDDTALQGAMGIIVALGCALGLFDEGDADQPIYQRSEIQFTVMCFGGAGPIITRAEKGDPVAS